MTDPDKGRWRYAYNAFGALVEQIDANNTASTLRYDEHGRRLERIDNRDRTVRNRTRWSYDVQRFENYSIGFGPKGFVVTGAKSVSGVIAHETGHAIGIGHDSLMDRRVFDAVNRSFNE